MNGTTKQEEFDKILENYIDTLAGYSTATYLLGIGDRHLENMMITQDGKLFHIDFGFIFGKEPNSFKQRMSTKIRISQKLVDPLGGIGGKNYKIFETKFVQSFLILRNKIAYIMNLMFLMIHSELPDLKNHDH